MKTRDCLLLTKDKVKKPRKAKLKTIAVLVEETAKILQRLVRVKAADESGIAGCITCGKREHWKKLQGGHFISRVHLATKIVEENVAPQCVHCNVFRAKDSLVMANYVDYMVDMYGKEFVTELRQMAVQPKKYTRNEIMEIKENFEKQLIELEKITS